MHIIQCMDQIFCVEFQREPLKFHTKYLTHTLKDMIVIQHWNFKSSWIYELISVFEMQNPTGCPVPDVSIYYMSNINELPDGILFHWFCKCTPPLMFLPLDIPSEYRPEHVTFGLLCVIFKFPSRIFCRRVPGFATDCPCGVWCRGLTTCLLYVGPPLEF